MSVRVWSTQVSIIVTRHAWLFDVAKRIEAIVGRIGMKVAQLEGKDKGVIASVMIFAFLGARCLLRGSRAAAGVRGLAGVRLVLTLAHPTPCALARFFQYDLRSSAAGSPSCAVRGPSGQLHAGAAAGAVRRVRK